MIMVHKYQVFLGTFTIRIPRDGQVLTIKTQDGTMRMWVLVDDENPCENRHFIGIGTGQPVSVSGFEYITTIFEHGGAYVWHFFEVHGD